MTTTNPVNRITRTRALMSLAACRRSLTSLQARLDPQAHADARDHVAEALGSVESAYRKMQCPGQLDLFGGPTP